MMTIKRILAIGVLAIASAGLNGCNVAGYVGYVAAAEQEIKVTAEYAGLQNQSVAVLVNADMGILYRFPQTQLEIGTAVTRELAGNVPGITVLDARQVVEYQTRNIYWSTATYSQIARALGVQRIVVIDVQDYRLHEPGNAVMYRGVISARVEAAEADSARPDDAVYSTMVTVAFPPDRPEGVPDANAMAIRKGVLDSFARTVGWKFYDHSETRENMGPSREPE